MALTTTHQVFQVALISAGTLVYSVAPTIAFSGGGFVPGTAAAATVNLNAAGIPSSVTLSNPGTNDGYASAPTGNVGTVTSMTFKNLGTTSGVTNQVSTSFHGRIIVQSSTNS